MSDFDSHCPNGHKITDIETDVLGMIHGFCKTCDQYYRHMFRGWVRVTWPRWDEKPITADDLPPLPPNVVSVRAAVGGSGVAVCVGKV